MTFVLKLDPDMVKLYDHTKMKFLCQLLYNCSHTHRLTDKQTDKNTHTETKKIIPPPYTREVIKAAQELRHLFTRKKFNLVLYHVFILLYWTEATSILQWELVEHRCIYLNVLGISCKVRHIMCITSKCSMYEYFSLKNHNTASCNFIWFWLLRKNHTVSHFFGKYTRYWKRVLEFCQSIQYNTIIQF